MLGGRRFHSTSAAKVNARSPRVLEDLIVGCSSRMTLDDRRVRLDVLTCMSWMIYSGAREWIGYGEDFEEDAMFNRQPVEVDKKRR